MVVSGEFFMGKTLKRVFCDWIVNDGKETKWNFPKAHRSSQQTKVHGN